MVLYVVRMKHTIILFVLLGAILIPVWFVAEIRYADEASASTEVMLEMCNAAKSNRDQFGKLVILFGDSISRGFGLKVFADEVTSDHPLYKFRSISSTANWALELNDRPERFVYCGGMDEQNIKNVVAAGVIRSGDVVVLEDAGDFAGGTAAYYSFWWKARKAASLPDVTVVLQSMFDYCDRPTDGGCVDANKYDLVRFASASDAGSRNDAIRSAAFATINPVSGSALSGSTAFIDMNWVMDTWKNSALAIDGVPVILGDGIYPNVWGQMKMTQQYLAAANLRQYLTDTQEIEEYVVANLSALSYGSTTFTASRARVRQNPSRQLGVHGITCQGKYTPHQNALPERFGVI